MHVASPISNVIDPRIKTAVKTADQTVTSSTTLVNDTHLFLPLSASAYYAGDMLLITYSTSNVPDFDLKWTYPAGTIIWWRYDASLQGTNAAWQETDETTVPSENLTGLIHIKLAIYTSTTAGTLQLTWAQHVSNAAGCTLKKGSYLKMTRLA